MAPGEKVWSYTFVTRDKLSSQDSNATVCHQRTGVLCDLKESRRERDIHMDTDIPMEHT